MLKTLGRITDGVLTRVVPKATASAGNCKYGSYCVAGCGYSGYNLRKFQVCCPFLSNGQITYKCEIYKQTCSC
ncbi:hypothetical protein AB0H43_27455 [Hamadaea sp. NPDC050747]|uniref:hypothetical protein n=1 Tax=Hamadaea sp. NPDC050747 TaxID=3155789 RepID=UPI0033DFD256